MGCLRRDMMRHRTGVKGLDHALGGGLMPGTLVVVAGATGIGKTHLGLSVANAGRAQEGRRGMILDVASRGDDQGESSYSLRVFGWRLRESDGVPARVGPPSADLLRIFKGLGLKSGRDEASSRAWMLALQNRLRLSAFFLYSGFAGGRRRVIVDGMEPFDHEGSAQFDYFEHVLENLIRLEDEWLAREALRENFEAHRSFVKKHRYDPATVTTVLLLTVSEINLDDVVRRTIPVGGPEFNASTLVLMGWREDKSRGRVRSMCVVKHRNSTHQSGIIDFGIGRKGLRIV